MLVGDSFGLLIIKCERESDSFCGEVHGYTGGLVTTWDRVPALLRPVGAKGALGCDSISVLVVPSATQGVGLVATGRRSAA